MKNVKKLLAVVLAFVMIFATIATAAAGGDDEVVTTTAATQLSDVEYYKAAVKRLVALNILEGYEDGELRLENNITRAEAVKMMYVLANGTYANGSVASVELYTGESKFTDVEIGAWYNGYINWAESKGIVNGIGNKLFAPNAEVKFSEVVKMLVKTAAIIWNDAELAARGEEAKYPYGFIAIADSEPMKIFDAMKEDIKGVSNNATRAEVAALIDAILGNGPEGYIGDTFQHVEELAYVTFLGTSDKYFADAGLSDAQIAKAKKGTKYIDLDGTWYVCTADIEDLVLGGFVTAYLNNDGAVVLLSSSAKAVAGKQDELALAKGKYTFQGNAVKFADEVIAYGCMANGLFGVGIVDPATLANKAVDDMLTLVYADNADDKVDAVIIESYRDAYLRNYKPVAQTVVVDGIGTVAVANIDGVADIEKAVEEETKYYVLVSNSVNGIAVSAIEVPVDEDVKVTKLADMDADEIYRTVIAGSKTYIYSDKFDGEYLTNPAVATTAEEDTPVTYDFKLDTDGRIVALRVHPGTEPEEDAAEYFAKVTGLAVEQVPANAGWDSEYKYTLTLVKVVGKAEVEIELPWDLALTLEGYFHEDQSESKGVELVTDNNGNKFPAITGKFVWVAIEEGKLVDIALVDEFNEFDDEEYVEGYYNSAYTGLISLDGDMIDFDEIVAIIYKGESKTVEEFIALCEDKQEFTANELYYGGLYLHIAPLTAEEEEEEVVTTYAYLVIGAHSKVDGYKENTFKYNITATVLGVSKTFESVDFLKTSAGLDNEFTTYKGKLAKATFENGKLAALTAMDMPAFSFVILDRTHGAMWTLANVEEGMILDAYLKAMDVTEIDEVEYTYVYEYYKVSYKKNTIEEAALADLVDTEIVDDEIASAQVIGAIVGAPNAAKKTITVKLFINIDLDADDLAIAH